MVSQLEDIGLVMVYIKGVSEVNIIVDRLMNRHSRRSFFD
jgi:hypothetical protein